MGVRLAGVVSAGVGAVLGYQQLRDSALSQRAIALQQMNRSCARFAELQQTLYEGGTTESAIPQDRKERRKVLDYLNTLASQESTTRLLSDGEVVESRGRDVNTLLANPFVMDQLLMNAAHYPSFLKLARRVTKIEGAAASEAAMAHTAVEFMNAFDQERQRCEKEAAAVRAQRTHLEKASQPRYSPICPYVREKLKLAP